MAVNRDFLFQSDPDRFKELVSTDDDNARLTPLVDRFHDLVLCEVIRYGLYNDTAMVPNLTALFRDYVSRMPEELCATVLKHASDFVANVPAVSANALLPFIAAEPRRLIVSTAVIDYVSLAATPSGDPMSSVREIVDMIAERRLANAGAAFGALLHVGDPRVCRLLLPLRDGLSGEEANEAVKCATGFIHSATVEFYLDWLEGMDGDVRDGLFGIVASGLAQLARKKKLDEVATGERPFPVSSMEPGEYERSMKFIPLEAFVRQIASRMRDLERSEPPPRVMPSVLAFWGVETATPASEMAQRALHEGISGSTGATSSIATTADSPGEWWDKGGRILAAWGILNPNGPTLNVLGLRDVGGTTRFYFRWMHMLGGETTDLPAMDKPTYDAILEGAATVDAGLRAAGKIGLFATPPHFMIFDSEDENMEQLLLSLVVRCSDTPVDQGGPDWGAHLAYHRKFGNDFFGWAGGQLGRLFDEKTADARQRGEEPSEMIRMLGLRYGHIPAFRDRQGPQFAPSPITAELLDEWWTTATTREARRQALAHLCAMWEGACGQMAQDGHGGLIGWDRVIEFLAENELPLPS
jgi:hypothetical protein